MTVHAREHGGQIQVWDGPNDVPGDNATVMSHTPEDARALWWALDQLFGDSERDRLARELHKTEIQLASYESISRPHTSHWQRTPRDVS